MSLSVFSERISKLDPSRSIRMPKSTYLIEETSRPKWVDLTGQTGMWAQVEIDREESIVLDTADDQT